MLYGACRATRWRLAWVVWGLVGVHGVSGAQVPEVPSRQLVAVLPQNATVPSIPTHPVFDGLLVKALSAHPNVRSALSQAQGAQWDVDVAKWAFWPSLTVNAQRTDDPKNAPPGSSNVTIQQPVWTAGALTARLAAAEKAGQASGEQIQVVRGDLALRLVDAWASLLDAEATRTVTERALEGLNRYQAIMQRRVQAGLSSAVELRLLSVRVTRAQTDLADAQVSSQIALQRLEQLVGAPVQSALTDLREPLQRSVLGQWVTSQPMAQAAERLAQPVPSGPLGLHNVGLCADLAALQLQIAHNRQTQRRHGGEQAEHQQQFHQGEAAGTSHGAPAAWERLAARRVFQRKRRSSQRTSSSMRYRTIGASAAATGSPGSAVESAGSIRSFQR